MVEKLKPDELAAFKEAFDTFDRNSDATISTKVREINESTGCPKKELVLSISDIIDDSFK